MEGIGAEVSQKIRSAIKAKLMEIGVYVDEELPDYVMVMVANKRTKDQMDEELQLFLGKHTLLFTTWLHQVLQKLQEVTVANLGGIKRKLSEDSKKKKKSKLDVDKKVIKKTIKIEIDDDNDLDDDDDKKSSTSKSKESSRDKKDNSIVEDSNSMVSGQHGELIENKNKDKNSIEQVKCIKSISRVSKQSEESSTSTHSKKKIEEEVGETKSKSCSTSSQVEDIDDEDCINIRTDGELLDTAEEINTEEPTRKQRDKSSSTSSRKGKDVEPEWALCRSPVTQKQRRETKSDDTGDDTEKSIHRESSKKQSPHQSPLRSNDKVVDARELLNRKKAAKESNDTAQGGGDKSVSPPRKRRDDNRETNSRSFHEDRDLNRRTTRENERETSSRKVSREDDKNKRNVRDRDLYSSKRRGEDRLSRRSGLDRTDLRNKRRRDSSNEPPSKSIMLERPYRNKNDDWDSARSSKMASTSESRKVEIESSLKKRELEEPRKRSGLVSRVVPRLPEPEDNVETPVPSVVKVTPRPRRPPSQQPSSNLIMKAISEANKSLANVPQRPDSTQRGRKEPLFTRTLRQLERIPLEKIAVSITNPLALQNAHQLENETESNSPPSPKADERARNRSPTVNIVEVTSSEQGNPEENGVISNEECNKEKESKKESQEQEEQEPDLEIEASKDLEEYDEQMEESSDPQFVVTLNGYDPDGLYSQSELDEGDNDDWLKEESSHTTTLPAESHCNPNSSPIVIMSKVPAVNHDNLINVDIVSPKSTERCKYWPACRLADKCTYYHPTKPCKVFPACKFGDACLYIHPQCKFNALCTRKDCVFAHSPAYTPSQPPVVPKALYAANALQPCKFYPNCTNINCQFAHPSRACRFGLYCTKKDCSFDHGQVAPVDKLKWTRVPPT